MLEHIIKNRQAVTDIMTLKGVNMSESEVAGLSKIQETIYSLGIRVFCNNAGFLRMFNLIREGRTEELIENMKSIKRKQNELYLLQGDGKIHQY